MKKLLSIVALFALIFTACETANEETKKSGIKLTTDSEVNVSSGSAMGFIKYELTAPVEGATVEATANVEWIGNFGYKEMGKISFTIDTNPDSVDRTGEITVTYDKSSFKVIINCW